MRVTGLLIAASAVWLALPAQAMQAAGGADRYAEVEGRRREAEAARELVRSVFSLPEAQQLANDAGLDIDWIRSGVDLLEGEELERAASLAMEIQDQLAGGQDSFSARSSAFFILFLVVIAAILV